MPAYVQGSTNLPLQALYPGASAVVWSAETPLVGTKSAAVCIARLCDNSVTSVSFEVKFSGAPGAYEIDIQEADTDEDAAYLSINNAVLTLSTNNYARYDMSPMQGRFVRALMKIATANAVTLIGKFSR
jgi:hypothetical protein